MSQTIAEPAKLTPEEVAALHRAAAANRALAMTIGRPLASGVSPMQSGRPGEPTVMMLIDKAITVTLDHPPGKRVLFGIGLQPIPVNLADHWFVQAHKFKRYGAGPAVGAEPEQAPELPPQALPSMDEAVAKQLQNQGEALQDAQAALLAKDQELADLRAQVAGKTADSKTAGPTGATGATGASGDAKGKTG